MLAGKVNPSRPDPEGRGSEGFLAPWISFYIRIKVNSNFNFTLLRDTSKGFMKALKAFIKPEAPQRSVKIKI